MGIYDIYSKRLKKRERAGLPDVYQYDDLPQELRVQIALIWRDVLGKMRTAGGAPSASKRIWEHIYLQMIKEKGVFHLGRYEDDPADEQCQDFLLAGSTEDALDIIEYSFRMIKARDEIWTISNYDNPRVNQKPDEAIKELNYRFREHAIGYQFEGGEIVRVEPNTTLSRTRTPVQ